MLDQTEINAARALSWLGMTVSIGLLAFNFVHFIPGLGAIAAGVLLLTCTHGLRCTLLAHDRALREAFEHGRDHGRLQAVANQHDRERL